MAGPHICYNAGGGSTNNSDIPVPISAISCAFTVAPAQTPASTRALAPTHALALSFVLASASVLGSPRRYTNEDLQKATKFALELFIQGQEQGQF